MIGMSLIELYRGIFTNALDTSPTKLKDSDGEGGRDSAYRRLTWEKKTQFDKTYSFQEIANHCDEKGPLSQRQAELYLVIDIGWAHGSRLEDRLNLRGIASTSVDIFKALYRICSGTTTEMDKIVSKDKVQKNPDSQGQIIPNPVQQNPILPHPDYTSLEPTIYTPQSTLEQPRL